MRFSLALRPPHPRVTLERAARPPTEDGILWMVIRTNQLGFANYSRFSITCCAAMITRACVEATTAGATRRSGVR